MSAAPCKVVHVSMRVSYSNRGRGAGTCITGLAHVRAGVSCLVKGEWVAHLSCSQQLVDRRQPCSQREPPVRARYRGWRRLFFAFPAGILDFHPLSSSDAHPGSVLSDRKPFRDTIGRVAAKREPARRLQPLVRMPNVKSGENDRNFLTLLQYL